jgi:hypothetical protein
MAKVPTLASCSNQGYGALQLEVKPRGAAALLAPDGNSDGGRPHQEGAPHRSSAPTCAADVPSPAPTAVLGGSGIPGLRPRGLRYVRDPREIRSAAQWATGGLGSPLAYTRSRCRPSLRSHMRGRTHALTHTRAHTLTHTLSLTHTHVACTEDVASVRGAGGASLVVSVSVCGRQPGRLNSCPLGATATEPNPHAGTNRHNLPPVLLPSISAAGPGQQQAEPGQPQDDSPAGLFLRCTSQKGAPDSQAALAAFLAAGCTFYADSPPSPQRSLAPLPLAPLSLPLPGIGTSSAPPSPRTAPVMLLRLDPLLSPAQVLHAAAVGGGANSGGCSYRRDPTLWPGSPHGAAASASAVAAASGAGGAVAGLMPVTGRPCPLAAAVGGGAISGGCSYRPDPTLGPGSAHGAASASASAVAAASGGAGGAVAGRPVRPVTGRPCPLAAASQVRESRAVALRELREAQGQRRSDGMPESQSQAQTQQRRKGTGTARRSRGSGGAPRDSPNQAAAAAAAMHALRTRAGAGLDRPPECMRMLRQASMQSSMKRLLHELPQHHGS